jgi:hypothetical protein
MVKSGCPHFSIGILGTEAGDMGQSHGVLRNAETLFGHAESFGFGRGNINLKFADLY